MTYDRKIYKEAEFFLKYKTIREFYDLFENGNKEQNKAVQTLITYNVLCKKGIYFKKGQLFRKYSTSD